jgi:hypothetical protein
MDLCLWMIKIGDKMRILGEVGVCAKMEKQIEEYRNWGDGKAGGDVAVVQRWCGSVVVVIEGCLGEGMVVRRCCVRGKKVYGW